MADLATLFEDAAEGRLADASLAQRANAWLPANLRDTQEESHPQPEAQNEAA